MARLHRMFTHLIPGLLLGCALSAPLQAQLDTRLQGSTTDFLNLFQQSSQAKVKPEVLTIFDFSGSMADLMYHPQYVNSDVSDTNATSSLDFTLHPATVAVPGQNTYTITAKANGCTSAYTTYIITVNGTGAVGVNTGQKCSASTSTYTIRAAANGSTTTYATIPVTVNSGVGSQTNNSTSTGNYRITRSDGTTRTNPITYTGSTTEGSVMTFTTYLVTTRTDHRIRWTSSDGISLTPTATGSSPYISQFTWTCPHVSPYQISNISTSTSTFTAGSTVTFNASLLSYNGSNTQIDWSDGNGHTGTGTSFTWTVPDYDPGTPAQDPYVSAAFGSSSLSEATCNQLIKPNGTVVTQSDASSATGSLYGVGDGASDVRNWVRAASHARFVYIDSSVTPNVTRTVDIPIPWKITDRSSTGNPLSSSTKRDRISKTSADGTTTNYGSNQDIEYDTNYALSSGSLVLDGDSTTQTTTSLSLVVYKVPYVLWLFTGKYQGSSNTSDYYSPTNAGKYIIYDAAAVNIAANQGTNLAWGQGYGTFLSGDTITLPKLKLDGTYDTEITAAASKNVVPALMRYQAVKVAAIKTWIQYQADVLWAFRFLSPSGEASNGSATTINNNSKTSISSNVATTTQTYGNDSGWKVLNNTSAQGNTSTSGNSVTGMQRIAALFPNGATPLTYAMARGLAQFADPNSVFNDVETGSNAPSQCMNHFLILFTDGIDNNGNCNYGCVNNTNGTTPYIFYDTGTGKYKFDAVTGNRAILTNKTLINKDTTAGSANWNLFTFAGVAAHMSDPSLGDKIAGTDYLAATDPGAPGTAAASGKPQAFLPYAIKRRNTTIFSRDHRITTMTVGVSLGGNYTDSSSPKRNLFLAAAIGDPSLSTWSDLGTLTPFNWVVDAAHPDGHRADGSIYFFDATDPDSLTSSLDHAIQSAIGASLVNVTTNPNLPYIGASLGKQIYLGKFQPPSAGGVMWSGDLLMFPTKVDSSGRTVLLTTSGTTATTLDASTATWSAATGLNSHRRWDARNLYTRIPYASSLSPFTYTGTDYSDDTSGLKNYVATSHTTTYPVGGTEQQNLVKLMMGANLLNPTSSTPSTANRANIMGDIIDSAPAYLEYKWSDVNTHFPSGSTLQGTDRTRFRLILVGTNQGWLHAFGETTKITKTEVPANSGNFVDLVSGEEDELWSFMPTDFLANLDYMNTSTNSHVFMVDGSPTIYFLDLPPTTGGTGNGVYDGSADTITNPLTDTTHERAIAIIGLRKGGRSYYALNLHNPFTPTLQWSLVPDEATDTNLHSRNKTGLTDAALATIISNMGYSTCAPSIGRILFNGVYKDAVFLGGGYSVPEIEAKFNSTTPPKLGRSVLAIDVFKGDILAAVDLSSSSIGGNTIGPIAAGLVPFEFFLGSGMAQRAYFTDLWGGLWAWGSKAVVSDANSSYNNFRKDTSELQNWSKDTAKTSPYANTGIRKIYQDAGSVVTEVTTTTPHTYTFAGPVHSTLPSPFLVGSFPGKGYTNSTTGKTTAIPAAVGIALESGDRNDPLDFGTNKPANTRLTVVFDRQDSRAWSLDSADGPDNGINADAQLLNAGKWGASGAISSTKAYGNALITPGSSTYYLAPSTATDTQFGYYVTFPDRQQDATDTTVYHYSKGINSPLVVAGSLFYSYFTPATADVCTGGSGYTYSNLICDVMNPIVKDVRTGITCTSGLAKKWFNVASDFSMLGAPGVQQAGVVDSTDATTGKTITSMETNTFLGLSQARYPKARVWRTVH